MTCTDTLLRLKMENMLSRKEKRVASKLLKLAGVYYPMDLSLIKSVDTLTLAGLIQKGFLTTTKAQFMVVNPH